MKYKIENQVLTIFLEGELNSFNSEDVEKELESIVNSNSFTSIILDLEKLTYISSAGLRIIVRLKQHFENTSLINVIDDVYDIFTMVGFEKVISISKIAQ